MLNPSGLLNQTLGLDVDWLTSSAAARWALVIMSIWKETGFFLILFLAGLARLPPRTSSRPPAYVYGANAWQRFRLITLPLLKPITAICSVIAVIRGFQSFSPQVVLTGGGFDTEVVNLFVYKTAFESARMGRASAVAVLMFGGRCWSSRWCSCGCSGGTGYVSTVGRRLLWIVLVGGGLAFAAVFAYAVVSAIKAPNEVLGAAAVLVARRCALVELRAAVPGDPVRPLLRQQHRRRRRGHAAQRAQPAPWPATASRSSATAGATPRSSRCWRR